MTTLVNVVAVVLVVLVVVLTVPKLMMASKARRMRGKPAPTPHKASAKRIKSGARTILYFRSPTCRACKTQDPIMRKVQKRYPDAVFTIDTAANREAVSAYGVMGVPYLAFIEGGKLVSARANVQREDALVGFIAGKRKT